MPMRPSMRYACAMTPAEPPLRRPVRRAPVRAVSIARDRSGMAGPLLCATAWAVLHAGAAAAQCAAPVERSIALEAAIAVPRDGAAGSVLYRADHPLPALPPGCADPLRAGGWRYANTPHPSQSQDIYRTGVAAVGLRVSINGQPLSTADYAPIAVPGTDGGHGSVRVELIKIDDAGSTGAVRGADLPSLVYAGEAGTAARVVFSGAIAVRAATCNTPSVRVVLDPVAPAALARPGSSAGAKNFELRLNDCPPGMARMSYRLDPMAAVRGAAASVVALDPGAGARGIGVQIRDRAGQPVAFGVDHRIEEPGIGAGGNFRVPLQAAYHRDGAQAVTPGSVSASLTFVITYE